MHHSGLSWRSIIVWKRSKACQKKRQWNYEKWKALSKPKTNFDWYFYLNRNFCENILIMGWKPTTKICRTWCKMFYSLILQQRLTNESRNAMKMKRTLNCNFVFVFKAIPDSNDLFWKSQFNENEKVFHLWFCLCFHTFCWKLQYNENERDFQASFWLCFRSTSQLGPFGDLFWKSQCNERPLFVKKAFRRTLWKEKPEC